MIAGSERSPGLLLLPGWDDDPERVVEQAEQLSELGCVCAWVSLPALEWTTARRSQVTREDNLRDVEGAFNLLASDARVDRDAIGLVGTSYGGYLGAMIAAAKGVRWFALRSPAIYSDANWNEPKESLDKQDLAVYRRQRLRPGDNRVLAACAAFRGDVLIVASELDRVVPKTVISNYLKAFGAARSLMHRTLAGADHALSREDWLQAYALVLGAWLQDRLREREAQAREIRAVTLGERVRVLPTDGQEGGSQPD